LFASLVVLQACGGDSGAAPSAHFEGATLKVTDQTGTELCISTVTASSSYSCMMPKSVKAPFVITASRDDEVLVSSAALAETGTINVTPLTHLLSAQLLSSGDPAKLADELKANPALFDQTRLQQKLDGLVALIKPLNDAVGTSQ
jgi:hypothetical protein